MASSSSSDTDPVKYDDVGWHTESADEAGQPTENAFTHIGFYLAWIIRHGLLDPTAIPKSHVAELKAGNLTGSDLADDIDGKLVSWMLTADGRAFSDFYYRTYLTEYARVFAAEPDYGVEDTPANYERIVTEIDLAYAAWVASGRPPPAPEDPNRLVQTPSWASGPGVPDSMTAAELEAHMNAMFEAGRVEEIEVGDLEMPHVAPDLERDVADRFGLDANVVSSVAASQWGSSMLARSLKRLGIRPRDAVVASAVTGDGENAVMVSVYSVPGVSAAVLEAEFATVVHRPSSRSWDTIDIAGQRVLSIADREFKVLLWAVDGRVFHLGASVAADLPDMVRRWATTSE